MAFRDRRRDYAYPNISLKIPQFHGKRGEDHCLKVDDSFTNFNVPNDERVNRFNETLYECPRAWYTSLDPLPAAWDGDGANTMKKVFTTRWSVKGKAPDALYAEWQKISFDSAKDYIEDFIGDVRQIATQLVYPEVAQAMGYKGYVTH